MLLDSLRSSLREVCPAQFLMWHSALISHDQWYTAHHNFATRCIESNCDYKTVSVLLGHANITTTLNLYVHPNMEQKKKCITKMFKSLGK